MAQVAALADQAMERHSHVRFNHSPDGLILAEEGLFPPDCIERIDDRIVRLASVRLFGSEFRLADPRDLYPGDDRVSFVFASLDGAGPAADGVLVLVEDTVQCRRYVHSAIQEADLYLCRPAIHLRYFAEAWIDGFLAFLRRFHMPELHYWHHQDLPGADRFDDLEAADEAAREEAWRDIQLALLREFEEWIPKGRELAAMREHILRHGGMPAAWLVAPYAPLQIRVNVVGDTSHPDTAALLRRLIFQRSEVEAAVRAAIHDAGGGLDHVRLPLHFQGLALALSSRFAAEENVIHVDIGRAGETE